VSPQIPSGSKVTWETLATGAAIPKVVPLPVQPTISPAAKAAFGGEVGGLRGLLLGGGQFAASRALGIGSLAAGLFVFGKAAIGAVKASATLEQELNVFQQVSGATADQMARVREESRKLGADLSLPAVSAGDAAATMTELAKAGLSVDQVLNGTKGTLQLAAAAQLDFATAAELSAGALNAFQLPGTQAVKVADLLAGAANAAQGNIADFGLALTQAGAVAHQAGLSVQETVTFLTELAKAGIQGSDAGTSLRVALLRLIAPTTEAQAILKALNIQITDAAGNVRVDVFEQLRRAMVDLFPATRNAALATIFGTDAIRSAAIFTREGAAGFEAMERQVSRQGQAADTAAARTKGLSGSVSGLVSNLDTLGTDLGTVVLPLLTELTTQASKGITAFDALTTKVINVTSRIAGIDVGPFGSIGDIVKDNIKNAVSAPFRPLHASIELMRGDFRGAGTDLEHFVPGATEAVNALNKLRGSTDKPITAAISTSIEAPGGSALDKLLKGSLQDPQLAKAMREAGLKAGAAFSKGTEEGITKEERGVINAAKRTVKDAQDALRDVVAEGQQAVTDTVRQGALAVQAAALEAKQNLTSIGQGLADQVTQILASGPLAQRIQNLQAGLDKSRAAIERGNLGRSLRDAKEELARAEAQLAGGAPKDAAQRQGEQEFLRPFKEKVKDAQAALSEFDTQGTLDKLTARLQTQTAKIGKQIADVVAKFNAGLVSGGQANAQLVAILQKNIGPIRKAGTAQGFAFKQAFAAQVRALQAQINAILAGPKTRKTGVEPTIVSPADVAAQSAKDVETAQKQAADRTVAAQRSVKDAIANLHKAEQAAVAGPDGTNEILRDIRRQLGGSGNSKPSADVKTPTKPRTRTGGR
jgi:TP901 family phage tail tape measure protein